MWTEVFCSFFETVICLPVGQVSRLEGPLPYPNLDMPRGGNKCQLLPKTEEFRQVMKGVGSQPFLEIKYTQYCFLQEEAGLFQMDTITNITVWTLFSTTS